jgi:cob(I)alamin adenosyltransferase
MGSRQAAANSGDKIMKIYTGTGDRGKTSLFSGERVTKTNDRIEAYGDLDELNSIIGALMASLPADRDDLIGTLQQIQSDIFIISAWLATTANSPAIESLEKFKKTQINFLEESIDRLENQLPELKNFILPGGHRSAAWAHVARSVCRRAERHTVRLRKDSEAGESTAELEKALIYLNRLSDYLFVLARECNRHHGLSDITWKKS